MTPVPATLAALQPALLFLASSAGSGLLASRLFDWTRAHVSPPHNLDSLRALPLFPRLFLTLLYAPRYARTSALVLAFVLSAAAQLALAALFGGDVGVTADAVAAAALSAVASQLMHGMTLPTEPTL